MLNISICFSTDTHIHVKYDCMFIYRDTHIHVKYSICLFTDTHIYVLNMSICLSLEIRGNSVLIQLWQSEDTKTSALLKSVFICQGP